MIYISNPSLICAKSSNIDELMNNISKNKPLQTVKSVFDKEYCVGEITQDLAKICDLNYKSRTNELLLSACLNMEKDILKAKQKYKRIAVVIGTTNIGVEENYNAFNNGEIDKNKYLEKRHEFSQPAVFISKYFRFNYLAYSISSACTSGTKAIIEACRLLENNIADCVLCGGVDGLSTLTIKGFDSLGILSNKPCKAFSKNRNGTNIAEGACVFLVTKDEINNVKIKSYYSNCDAYHITQPDTSANFQSKMIKEAFTKSGLKKLDYINLHGTATLANDIMESKLCNLNFKSTPATSIKPFIGHTLGAAGAIEIGYCVYAISKKLAIKPALIDVFDDSLSEFNLLKNDIYINSAMSLSFAFGGDNACVVVSNE